MIGWALRWVLSCCGIALLYVGFVKLGPEFFVDRTAKPEPAARVAGIGPAVNTRSRYGHF